MCHLISVVSAYIFGAVRNLKSTLPAVLFLLVSSFAVTAQANVVFDFEGYTANYQTDDPDTPDVDESTLPDGTYTVPDGEYAFPAYGGVGSGIVSFVDPDDSSESAVLVVENGAGGEIWGGVTIAAEYVDSDFIGDGSSPVTIRVFADQNGDFNFELEADGQTPVIINQMVSAGWNDISIDVSNYADVNWHRIQIRPDQLAGQANSEVTKYFFDDIAFPNATIVQAPAPTNPSSAAFLAGATAPTIGSADVLSLFSGAYDANDAFDSIASWSQPNTSQSELTIDNANVVKRYSDATFVGYEGMDYAVGGYENLNISLYRQDASNFEIKLVDTRYEDADGNLSTRDAVYYIENMVADEWTTVQIPLADFSQSISKIDQIVIKPVGGAETFYLDDFYFNGVLPTTVNLTLDLGGNADAFVYINSSLWSWVDDGMNGDAISNGDGTYTYTTTQPAFTSFEYQWYVEFVAEDLTTILAGSCNESLVTLGYAERVHVPPAEVVAEVDVLDTFGECHAIDTDGDEIPNSLDPDDDNDGVEDANDWDPLDANFASKDWEVAAFQESFGGTTITGSAVDGDGPLYTFPTSTTDDVVQDWAGFANQHTQVYPLYFTNAGSITFNASVPLGGSADVRFKLEKNPHPDVNPSYDIAAVTVTGAAVAQYTVAIPPQGTNVYKSLLMYLNTRDVGVIVTDVVVDSDPESGGYDPTAGVVTFSVDMNGVQLNDSIPNVLGDFNGYCGGQCAPMTDVDGDGIWTLEITLSASNVGDSYIFALGDTQETLLSSDGAEVACSNRSYYGDVADDGSQAFTLSRSLQFEGDTVLETVPFNGCAGGTDPEPTVPATPTGGLVLDFENMVDAGAYPVYGGVGASIGQKTEVDGVTVRNMLVLDNGAGAQWWSGVTIVAEYVDSDLIGDGSAPVTMRVYADQDGNLNFELEADGQTSVIINKAVVAGWNSLSFDVSAHAAINWHKAQIRPDALGEAANGAATKYYIDDVHFANATIVAAPAPTNPTSAAFLAGGATPTETGVVSLFSDAYSSALDGENITSWSDPNSAHSEMTIDSGNTIKKFDQTVFAGFDVPVDFSIDGKTTLSVSLYRQASSDFEVKLVDLTSGTVNMIYVIPAADMPVDQWSTVDVALSDFTGSVTNVDQLVIKPMGGAEAFYLDDMYFHGTAVVVVDSDGDGVADADDAFPNDSTESVDADGDGVGANADYDDNDASVQTAPAVTTTDYCSTEVTHFNIDNHPGSILVTIENSGADSVDVTATSVDDVIDLLVIENVDGGGTASATDITGGVATATISWAAGTMPATASFGMLWSDEAAPGNQMLNKGDGADAVGSIDTAFDCATDHPVPSTPVVPSTVNVTFQVDMSAVTVDPTGVYVAGGALFANAGQALSDDDNDGIWTLTTAIDANSTVLYKFRNKASTGDSDWGGFEDQAGLTAGGCNSGQYNDRIVTVTDQDVVLDVVAYGSCTATPYVSPIAPPTFTLTNVADSVTAVRMVGPGWNGWDANGGPAATKNDDGTWSVTVDPAPADTWEYKWTLDGVQEILHTPAGNGDCTAEIDAGRLHTDYSVWGNRLWPTDAGDVTDIANACAGTDLTPAPVDSDGDGVADDADAFPNDATETADTDSDGTGDNADAFPNDASETADTDSDGTGDNADAFPNDASETADTDSDGTGDNADAFPNDASETADTDSDGVGDNSDYAPNDPNVTVAPALPEQQVSIVGTPTGLVGSDVKVTVSYDASNGDDTVTGLGIRLHYDSSVLTFVSQSDVLEVANIGASGPYNDDDNDDSDTSTDKYVDGAWASFGGTWPGALPAELFTVTFTVNDVDSASTDINFSSTSTAVGYEFAPTSYSMGIIEGSFDFDGNGTFDALTDGLLFLRYAFDYRGDAATNGVVATDSPKTDAEVLASLETAMSTFGDIDGNGAVDALTDGLLLIRSLFGFTGDALILGAVGDSTTTGAVSDATRTTAAEIQTYIDSMSL
jgi:hypothetical protein